MANTNSPAHTLFKFGDMKVEILQGSILKPGVPVDAVVSTDDNYMTMGSGVAALLRKHAGAIEYVREAQDKCPVKAGSVVVTQSYGLKDLLNVDYVLHGAVIDYDTDVLSLPDLVEQTTANCLEQAEVLGLRSVPEAKRRGLRSILFPAFATGSGKLSMEDCARRMCNAIKAYVGRERPLKSIYIMLYLPDAADAKTTSADLAERSALNERPERAP